VHAASVQDRDGAALVLDHRTRALFPFVLAIFADAGYQGPRAASAARRGAARRGAARRGAAGAGGCASSGAPQLSAASSCSRSAGSSRGRWPG
jgi:hypothetical protein